MNKATPSPEDGAQVPRLATTERVSQVVRSRLCSGTRGMWSTHEMQPESNPWGVSESSIVEENEEKHLPRTRVMRCSREVGISATQISPSLTKEMRSDRPVDVRDVIQHPSARQQKI